LRRPGSIAQGACVQVICKYSGQTISGPFGPDSTWDWIVNPQQPGPNGYVSDEYVDTKGAIDTIVPLCPSEAGGG
jgi:hypothetical protein